MLTLTTSCTLFGSKEKTLTNITDTASLNRLGTDFFTTKHYKDAVACFKASADQGNAYAQFLLARCYNRGYGVEKNLQLGFKYNKLAADQGHSDAQFCVYSAYSKGKGITENDEQAIKYLTLASQQENCDGYSTYRLGRCYEHGFDTTKDNIKALKYYYLASDQGQCLANLHLGQIYGEGLLGLPKDRKLAEQYFDKAANHNERMASIVARLHRAGRYGLKKDINKYIVYATSAAKKGITSLYFDLAKLYELGKEVPQDYEKSLEYYKKALEVGCTDAKSDIKRLEKCILNTKH